MNSIEEQGLYIMNQDTKSWMGDRKRKPSNLDLCFATEEIEGRVTSQQEKEVWDSNHYPIVVRIKFEKVIYKKKL